MIYQLKISLKDISPPICRRVLVPSIATFKELHDIIQYLALPNIVSSF